MIPWLMPRALVQVVLQALDAAKYRRARIEQLNPLSTPGSSRTGSTKRKNLPKRDDSAVLTASTTASGSEKVTPDPKHIRTGDEEIPAPEPKALFMSPELEEGGVFYSSRMGKVVGQ